MKEKSLLTGLKRNLQWFAKSGIMSPNDGSWGVAERILVTEGNEAKEKVFKSFPAYLEGDGYAVIEQRRPDCNFETALLHFLASEALDDAKPARIAGNILTYLYRRSGMLNAGRSTLCPPSTWQWSHDQWGVGRPWFDDNAWNCVIPLILARLRPELDGKFGMKSNALALADEMEKGFSCHFPEAAQDLSDERRWSGDLKSPHWGSLAVMAFAFAYAETRDRKYAEAIGKYNSWIEENSKSFSTSEHAYAVIGCAAAAVALDDKRSLDLACAHADILLSRMDAATGQIKSEWGKEAPVGERLVDLIYTQNWALLAFMSLRAVVKERRFEDAFEKMLGLLLAIQDKSKAPQFNGCWRGMYDMDAQAWGGGDRYEGGAGSIYSGWTNAPIGIVLASVVLGISPLTDFAKGAKS